MHIIITHINNGSITKAYKTVLYTKRVGGGGVMKGWVGVGYMVQYTYCTACTVSLSSFPTLSTHYSFVNKVKV